MCGATWGSVTPFITLREFFMDGFAKWAANDPLAAYSNLGAIEIETLVVLGLALLTGICILYRK